MCYWQDQWRNFMTEYEGVLQGNFGQSTRYGEPVLRVISERLPVSSYFGILTFVITYRSVSH